ncbi:hypothetical protein GGD83_004173 [Rhodoblastus sphagnicola]|nr:hypothetical protein [Rhodoblastus sphagnicola]
MRRRRRIVSRSRTGGARADLRRLKRRVDLCRDGAAVVCAAASETTQASARAERLE